MYNKPVLLASLTLMILTLTACAKSQPEMVVEPETVIEPEGPVNIRNPVKVYCTGLGYEYTTRERKIDKPESQPETPVETLPETLEGPHPGIPAIPDYYEWVVCAFPDGNECEEEEFRSGRCGQEYSYCVQQGYTLEPGASGATCVFPDDSFCLEFDFFNGDCGPAGTQLSDTEWDLVFLNRKNLIEDTEIRLKFTEKYLGGEMGCNGYGGSPDTGKYTTKGDGTFTLGSPFAVTVQLCADPEGIMEQEAEYIEALMAATHYQILDDRLEIKNEAGEITLIFQKK